MPRRKDGKDLTTKERLLVFSYLECMDYHDAAIAAGYAKGKRGGGNYSRHGAIVWAHTALRKPHVQEFLNDELEKLAMPSQEVIYRTDQIARGDIGHYISDDGTVDIAKARRDKRTGIIKKLKVKQRSYSTEGDGLVSETDIELELYPADAALERLWKMYGLDKQKIEHSGEVVHKGYVTVSPDDWDDAASD